MLNTPPTRDPLEVKDDHGKILGFATWGEPFRNWFMQIFVLVRRDLGRFTTATRPTSNLQVGYHGYDETLGQEIYVKSLGPLVWADAMGNTIP